jgi:membrane-bound ClpP family serine protease
MGMSDPLVIWAIVCLVAALVLLIIEVFVPSGGLLGLASGALLITGIVLLFQVNTMLGLVGAIVLLTALPFVVGYGLKIAPNTPVLRMLSLQNREDRAADARSLERGEQTGSGDTALVGAQGTAVTDLRPVGTCMIHGRRRECLSESGMIRAGTKVRIVHADGMQIKVRVDEA